MAQHAQLWIKLERMSGSHNLSNSHFLHVANGTSTTRSIRAAGIPGELSIWADPLHEGPVPGGLDDAALLEVRARHLAGLGEAPAGDPWAEVDPVNDLRQWRAVIERHQSYDELVLWYEHDLFDQLNLIQLLNFIRERVPSGKVVSLVCIGSYPGRPNFKGLGELTPGELASLFPPRRSVSEEQYSLAAAAWRAFREPTPEPLDLLRRGDTSALPYLARALTRFLEEYPWSTDGLSRSERRLLELASGDGITLIDAFPRMYDDENTYHIVDTAIASVAADLSHTSPPLLTLTSEDPTGARPLSAHATLTAAGAAVLAGEQDRVKACGIDRWFGGVHLQSSGRVWRWDPLHGSVVAGTNG